MEVKYSKAISNQLIVKKERVKKSLESLYKYMIMIELAIIKSQKFQMGRTCFKVYAIRGLMKQLHK
jgi:hypothetical protein